MSKQIDLSRLAEPFPAEDIEWRVARAGQGTTGVWCKCLSYITARAISNRLDEVCGTENWQHQPPQFHEVLTGDSKNPKATAVCVGISIRIDGEWITKWDVAEPTDIEPVKGGFSGAMKRAGAQFGIGRYLYHIEEAYAEVNTTGGKGWNWAKLPENKGGAEYYWKPPALPSWALPKETTITAQELGALKKSWWKKFAPDEKNQAVLNEGFTRFVASIVGEFPFADYTCWTRDALERVAARIQSQGEAGGVSGDVPFEK